MAHYECDHRHNHQCVWPLVEYRYSQLPLCPHQSLHCRLSCVVGQSASVDTYHRHSRSSSAKCDVASHHIVLVQSDIWAPWIEEQRTKNKRVSKWERERERRKKRVQFRRSVSLLIYYLILCFWFVVAYSTGWIALLRCQILRVFEQNSLKLSLAVHVQQLLAKVHISKYGGERAASFQRIFGAFL